MQKLLRLAKPVLGLTCTVFFVYLASRGIDFAAVEQAASNLTWQPIALSLLLLVADFALKTLRWWYLLRVLEPSLPLAACGWPLVVGFALNNVMPLRAGDIARAFGFRAQLQTSAARVLGSLVVERLLDLLVLLGCLLIGMGSLGPIDLPPALIRLGTWGAGAGIVAVAMLFLAPGILRHLMLKLIDWAYAKTGIRKFADLSEPANDLFEAMGVVSRRSILARVLVTSVLAWSFEAAIFATIAASLDHPLAIGPTLFIMATGTLSTLIPSSPGCIGTFDYFTIQAAMVNGMPADVAALLAILVHLVLWAPITLAGATYFLRPNAWSWWKQTRASAVETTESA